MTPAEIQEQLQDLNDRLRRMEKILEELVPAAKNIASPPRPTPPRQPTPPQHIYESQKPIAVDDEDSAWIEVGDVGLQRSPFAARADRRSLEQVIAERWMAWVGSVVLLLAVGFFIKLGYDLGWWGRLTPLARCLVCAGFGAGLIVGGEISRRRVSRPAAVGLFGAGVGTLYLTSFASFRYFHLLSESGAFWLMLLVVFVGIAITLHGHPNAIGW